MTLKQTSNLVKIDECNGVEYSSTMADAIKKLRRAEVVKCEQSRVLGRSDIKSS